MAMGWKQYNRLKRAYKAAMPAGHAFGVCPLRIEKDHRLSLGFPYKLLCFWQLHIPADTMKGCSMDGQHATKACRLGLAGACETPRGCDMRATWPSCMGRLPSELHRQPARL